MPERLGADTVNFLFVDSVFFHPGDIAFQWNYAFLIVLDVHLPVSVTPFSQLP